MSDEVIDVDEVEPEVGEVPVREAALAGLWLVACALVVVGVASLSPAAAWIAGGVLLAIWAYVVLAEAGDRS